MKPKNNRQAKILDLMRECSVSSQQELSRLLRKSGMKVTQPTLSRDVRQLGLIKAQGLYRIPEEHVMRQADSIRDSLRQLVVQSGLSQNIVMVRTSPGRGPSLGVVLDTALWPEVLGTVAGDDTVFMLLCHPRYGRRVLRRVLEYSA